MLKIIFIILSEVLIFAYAVGYLIFFFRTIDMPTKLRRLMERNGFELVRTVEKTDYSQITTELSEGD